ncbi:MAG: metallophosphoesterase [Clostridiales bacterium]|nr:metallophosphoesterase [Clostridiales bacterium]
MFSITNFFTQLVYKILTWFFTLEFGVFSLISGFPSSLPETPEDFTPVLRFAVCSDIHLQGEENLHSQHYRQMFDELYEYADAQDYSKLDAIITAGDMVNTGSDEEYEQFIGITSEGIREGTQFLCVLGNHEFIKYRDYDPKIGYEKYKKYVCEDVDRHLVINGFHFILTSYSDDARTFTSKKGWMKAELDKAVADRRDMPVFCIQHPQPFNTVYGSVNWGDFDIKTVYKNYPQVVDFSGHSHYSTTDPRSIWQGSFTSIGTGSTACLMSNLNLISGDEDVPGESATVWIVEADADGNVRLKLLDIPENRFFEKNEYYLTGLSKVTKRTHTWGVLKKQDTAPVFPEGSKVSTEKNEDGTVNLLFPDAECYWGAEDYKVTVSRGLKNIYEKTYFSNYVRTVKNGMSINIGSLEPGEYSVKIVPVSPYAKTGKALTGTVEIV